MQALSRISHKKIQRRRLRYRYKSEFSVLKLYKLIMNNSENKHSQGKGVKIYIIDSYVQITIICYNCHIFHISGIDVKNPDFGGRAKWVHTTRTCTTI